jgi:hypothetical protein
VEAAHRSIVPNIPGVPWWAALLIATIATATGYAIDAGSGHKQLTHAFAGLYIAGCVAAVLAVRQSGVFTAVIQPPLILFCAVPGAYWLFHGGKGGNIKDLLINCGYPLIERFPLMLGTAGGVLLIGLVRWYSGMAHRTTAAAKANDEARTDSKSAFSSIAAKFSSLLQRDSEDSDDLAEEVPSTESPRARAVGRSPRTSRATRGSRSAQSPARARSRHARPSVEDEHEPPVDRARRQSRRRQPTARDFDAADPPRRSGRRPRPQGDPDPRSQPSRETRRDSYGRRNPYERPTTRSSRFDPYDAYEPAGPPEHLRPYEKPHERYEPYEPYEPYESYEQPRRRARPGPNGANPTHHPISQVRYRGSAPRDEQLREEPRAERRGRSRAPGRPQAESWEYDI